MLAEGLVLHFDSLHLESPYGVVIVVVETACRDLGWPGLLGHVRELLEHRRVKRAQYLLHLVLVDLTSIAQLLERVDESGAQRRSAVELADIAVSFPLHFCYIAL